MDLKVVMKVLPFWNLDQVLDMFICIIKIEKISGKIKIIDTTNIYNEVKYFLERHLASRLSTNLADLERNVQARNRSGTETGEHQYNHKNFLNQCASVHLLYR